MSRNERWAILGGGMLGLALAYRLAPRGYSLSVFEASEEWGGLAAPQDLAGVVWDRFYHVILASDLRLRRLLTDLGLEGQLRWTRTKTTFYSDGRFHPMTGAVDYLRFPLLGPLGKLRLAGTLLDLYRRPNAGALDSTGIETYLRRLSGRRVFEAVWLPLLRAKLGENYRKVSAAFIWAVVRRLLAARRAGLSEELFGYLPGGYARVLGRLVETLAGRGVCLQLRRTAIGIRRVAGGRVEVQFAGGHAEQFDRVIATIPSPFVARVCPDLTADERASLQNIEYQGVICVTLLMRRPLTESYLTYITDPETSITGVVEMSNLVDAAEFAGHSLVYLPKYLGERAPLFDAPDEEILRVFLDDLRRMHPGLRGEDILASQVSRARHVFALPVPHYSRCLPPMRTTVPGLHVVNSSYIRSGTLNMNETVGLADDYARIR